MTATSYMLNLNEVRLLGAIAKIGDLKQTSYAIIELILDITQATKNNKTQRWENVTKQVAVTFFGKQAEEIASLDIGMSIFICAEVSTRFNQGQNGQAYANTGVYGKRYQVVSGITAPAPQQRSRSSQAQMPVQQPLINLDDFEDDIPF